MLEHYVAVIQAGGKGTRLLELTKDKIPKPLLALNGKPMIEWQINNLKKYGIREFVIIIGHLGEKLKTYFGDGNRWEVHIQYIEEAKPLGSGGALFYLRDKMMYENFLLIFGDVMFDVDMERLISFHETKHAMATLLVHPNSHPQDSDLVVLDAEGRVIRFDAKTNKRDYWYENCVNAGIYVVAVSVLNQMDAPVYRDLEKELLMPYMKSGELYGYRTTEYVKDAGTVQRFWAVSDEQLKGLWKAKNLDQPQKCIFLDRDGTLNRYDGLISQEEKLVLEKNAAEAVKLINASGYLAIVVTNQPVVARGMCSIDELKNIHRKLGVLLGREGAYLDDVIFCPHHPDKGYLGENPAYKISCTCRKPQIGMVEKMAARYNIDLQQSYIVGDSTIDIMTGKNAGMKTVLVHTGVAGRDEKYDVRADIEARDLLDAVQKIIML